MPKTKQFNPPGLIQPQDGEEKVDTSKLVNHIAIILDSSGSMGSIVEEARNNFNEQIQTIKKHAKDIKTYITIVTFDDELDTKVFDEEASKVGELTKSDYVPSGSTALFDAMGVTITRFKQELDDIDDPNTSFLFVIITDGEENASKEFGGDDGRIKLKKMVDKLQKDDRWTFTFMGADAKVLDEMVRDMSFTAGNVQALQADAQGMDIMSQSFGSGLKSFYMARSEGKSSISNFYSGSHTGDAKKEDDEENAVNNNKSVTVDKTD